MANFFDQFSLRPNVTSGGAKSLGALSPASFLSDEEKRRQAAAKQQAAQKVAESAKLGSSHSVFSAGNLAKAPSANKITSTSVMTPVQAIRINSNPNAPYSREAKQQAAKFAMPIQNQSVQAQKTKAPSVTSASSELSKLAARKIKNPLATSFDLRLDMAAQKQATAKQQEEAARKKTEEMERAEVYKRRISDYLDRDTGNGIKFGDATLGWVANKLGATNKVDDVNNPLEWFFDQPTRNTQQSLSNWFNKEKDTSINGLIKKYNESDAVSQLGMRNTLRNVAQTSDDPGTRSLALTLYTVLSKDAGQTDEKEQSFWMDALLGIVGAIDQIAGSGNPLAQVGSKLVGGIGNVAEKGGFAAGWQESGDNLSAGNGLYQETEGGRIGTTIGKVAAVPINALASATSGGAYGIAIGASGVVGGIGDLSAATIRNGGLDIGAYIGNLNKQISLGSLLPEVAAVQMQQVLGEDIINAYEMGEDGVIRKMENKDAVLRGLGMAGNRVVLPAAQFALNMAKIAPNLQARTGLSSWGKYLAAEVPYNTAYTIADLGTRGMAGEEITAEDAILAWIQNFGQDLMVDVANAKPYGQAVADATIKLNGELADLVAKHPQLAGGIMSKMGDYYAKTIKAADPTMTDDFIKKAATDLVVRLNNATTRQTTIESIPVGQTSVGTVVPRQDNTIASLESVEPRTQAPDAVRALTTTANTQEARMAARKADAENISITDSVRTTADDITTEQISDNASIARGAESTPISVARTSGTLADNINGRTAGNGDIESILKTMDERVFGDNGRVNVENDIRTPEGARALGETRKYSNGGPSVVSILREQGDPNATYHHEAVHKVMNDYVNEKSRRQLLIDYARKNNLDISQGLRREVALKLEEQMADDFIQFVAHKQDPNAVAPKLTTRIKQVFNELWSKIRGVIARRNYTNDYKRLFDDLYNGKFATREMVSDGEPSTKNLIFTDKNGRQYVVNDQVEAVLGMAADDVMRRLGNNGYEDARGNKIYINPSTINKMLELNTRNPLDTKSALRMRRDLVGNMGEVLKIADGPYVQQDMKPNQLSHRGVASWWHYYAPVRDIDGNEKIMDITVKHTLNGNNVLYTVKEAAAPIRSRYDASFGNPVERGRLRSANTNSRLPVEDGSVSTRSSISTETNDILSNQKQNVNIGTDTGNRIRGLDQLRKFRVDPEQYTPAKDLLDGRKINPKSISDIFGHNWRESYPSLTAYVKNDGVNIADLLEGGQGQFGARFDDASDFLKALTDEITSGRSSEPSLAEQWEAQQNATPENNTPTVTKTGIVKGAKAANNPNTQTREQVEAEVAALATLRAEQAANSRRFMNSARKGAESLLSSSDNIVNGAKNSNSADSIPLKKGVLTGGNLYSMTKIGAHDYVGREIDGHREHIKAYKNGKTNVSWEVRGQDGKWYPETQAAYTWHTQKDRIDETNNQLAIKEALASAKRDGQIIDFVAMKNEKGDGVEVKQLPKGRFTIDGGIVRNPETGEIVGNHIQVTPFGIINQVGGKYDVLEASTDANQWKNVGGLTKTFARILEQAAPSKDEFQRVYDSLVGGKTRAEANYRTDLAGRLKDYDSHAKSIEKAMPKGVKRKDFLADIFDYGEGKFVYDNDYAAQKKHAQATIEQISSRLKERGLTKVQRQDLRAEMTEAYAIVNSAPSKTQRVMMGDKYGKDVATKVNGFIKYTRDIYDKVLDEVNAEYRQLGRPEVPKRQDYMTHIREQDFLEKLGVTPDMYRNLTGVMGDFGSGNRGELSGAFAGLTESRRPNTKWNPFFQQRRSTGTAKDPFMAMETYLKAALYNKYMTEPTMRARGFEAQLRTQNAVRDLPDNSIKELPTESMRRGMEQVVKEYKNTPNANFVTAVQEWANALAGKSTRIDRWAQDASSGSRAILRGLQKLQSITGSSKVMGNLSSTLSQTLNLPDTVRDNGMNNTVRGLFKIFGDDTKKAMAQSDFLKSRYTDVGGKYTTSTGQKIRQVISNATGMNMVEKAMVELSWSSAYQKALQSGKVGYEAVRAADQQAAKTVGARGIGDMPEAYRSTIGKTFLQFTYEVNESGKNTIAGGLGGVARYFVTAAALNALFGEITGSSPLPDPIGAGIETVQDLMNSEDDTKVNGDQKDNDFIQALQRFLAQTIKMNPVASAGANFMPRGARADMFGSDSDLGRYEGATGAGQTLGNFVSMAAEAAKGNSEGVGENVRDIIPVGSQIRKTTQGIEASEGGGVMDVVKGALFGKNALSNSNTSVTKLSEKQLETATSLVGESGVPTKDIYEAAVANKKANSNNLDYKGSMQEFNDIKNIKLAEGVWKLNNDWVMTNAEGNINRSFYRDVIRLQSSDMDESDESFDLFRIAYNLPDVSKATGVVSGVTSVENLKKLSQTKSIGDVINVVVSMAKGASQYEDIPEWVVSRYATEVAGMSNEPRGDVAIPYQDEFLYAVGASYDNADKKQLIYNDISKLNGREDMLNYLVNGRRNSAQAKKWATDGVLDDMYDEGLISYDERKWLKSITGVNKDGLAIYKKSSSRSGGGSKKIYVPEVSLGSIPNISGLMAAKSAPEVGVAINQGRGIVKGITTPKVDGIKIEPLKRLSTR